MITNLTKKRGNLTSPPLTASLDSAATRLQAKKKKEKKEENVFMCAENTPFPSMLDLGHRADRQWNANVCMLTNSTAP